MVRCESKSRLLLKIWLWRNKAELPFSEIVKIAKEELGVSKRTVINYLNALVEQQFLVKRVDNERHTFYKLKKGLKLRKAIIKILIDDIESLVDHIDDEELLEHVLVLLHFILYSLKEELRRK